VKDSAGQKLVTIRFPVKTDMSTPSRKKLFALEPRYDVAPELLAVEHARWPRLMETAAAASG
jgi:hypothetical protein